VLRPFVNTTEILSESIVNILGLSGHVGYLLGKDKANDLGALWFRQEHGDQSFKRETRERKEKDLGAVEKMSVICRSCLAFVIERVPKGTHSVLAFIMLDL
jgi:hypothetical protein